MLFSDGAGTVTTLLPNLSQPDEQDLLEAFVVHHAGAVPHEVCLEC